MITNFGCTPLAECNLAINVSSNTHRLDIQQLRLDLLDVTNPATGQVSPMFNASITNGYSSDGWFARSNWFVYVENEHRVWSYDGNRFLWLLNMDTNGNAGNYGPRSFPCKVPKKVLDRISGDARNAINNSK